MGALAPSLGLHRLMWCYLSAVTTLIIEQMLLSVKYLKFVQIRKKRVASQWSPVNTVR